MNRCLDEGTLQSFSDGELSDWQIEKVTSHLSHCDACASATRELARENELVSAAMAPEFEAGVPTEHLRRRIDEAIAGLLVVPNQEPIVQRWANSLLGAFSLRQPVLAYGTLAATLLFATIAGVVYLRSKERIPNLGAQMADNKIIESTGGAKGIADVEPPPGDEGSDTSVSNVPVQSHKPLRSFRKPKKAVETVAKVELLPGERSYLRTIAALDSTINSNDRPMRPALRAEYERNLALVDRALAAARTAAKSNPNDPDAADFVFAAYQSKVDLLSTVADARSYNRQP
ncbi:MAG TPA: hypothetical protein VJ023_15565 [Pyrinomonadaceae bacterium]|nr:hypothetical protein [Pyrinomonadaceae bacterium]